MSSMTGTSSRTVDIAMLTNPISLVHRRTPRERPWASSLSTLAGLDELLSEEEDDDGTYLSPEEDEFSEPRTNKPSSAASTRKPGARKSSSRSARDILRKTNHSRIEKRRREKINDALASLRELVPHDINVVEGNGGGGGSSSNANGGRRKTDKEFKLEVLERTVVYVRKLAEKVKQLEEEKEQLEKMGKAANERDEGRKRRKVMVNVQEKMELDELERMEIKRIPGSRRDDDINVLDSELPSSKIFPPGSDYTIRLPPISSLISSLPPNQPHTQQLQLPSPPSSVRSDTSNARHTPFPPPLTLPSPIYSHMPPAPWTRDEETAASLLLQFSWERKQEEREGLSSSAVGQRVHTPGSFLGLERDRGGTSRKLY